MAEFTTNAVATTAPTTRAEAMDPAWLTQALAPLTEGSRITEVEVVEVIRTVATKIRFKVRWSDGEASLCLKAFLDMERPSAQGTVEADFYAQLAPHLDVRVPPCVATVADRESGQGIVIMRDLIAEGATFCSALDPFSVDQAAASLEQLARLHASAALLERAPWVTPKVAALVSWNIVSPEKLQELLHGSRGRNLDARTRDAGRLTAAMNALAEADAAQPATLVHGDFHAGNSYRTKDGPGLIDWQVIQRGGWALDVAYHLGAALPVETAEAHEWALLDHYLDQARRLGASVPDAETARTQYRTAMVYGFYMWAITTRVDPAIIEVFNDRLGKAVMRLGSYDVLSV